LPLPLSLPAELTLGLLMLQLKEGHALMLLLLLEKGILLLLLLLLLLL
jgi:hypothetical protein